MGILRAKTLDLRQTSELTEERNNNSIQNETEAVQGDAFLSSMPRRFVLELTNACNLSCVMCGRNATNFNKTVFDVNWLKKLDSVAHLVEEVTLMGWGEPTVHPKFKEFLSWANSHGLRKYFCTNGMLLDTLFESIIDYKVDIIAVSMDGATEETNNKIRRGADFYRILKNIEKITKYKAQHNLSFPYMNFVFTASKTNLHELPKLVELAGSIGLDEVKVVYLTAFDDTLVKESLYNCQAEVKEVFELAIAEGKKHNVSLKLPYYQGEDVAGNAMHKLCYAGCRDFFLGSDGFVRPCMSSAEKLFSIEEFSSFNEMWNHESYQKHRSLVNKQMDTYLPCKNCYQSSFANWNKEESFLQVNKIFSPEWNSLY